MSTEPVTLPSKLPCWVKAIYSWSGENEGDLGFVEGDLIECLHTGDGLWWHGRLKRNNTQGVFPCNFIEIIHRNSLLSDCAKMSPPKKSALKNSKSLPYEMVSSEIVPRSASSASASQPPPAPLHNIRTNPSNRERPHSVACTSFMEMQEQFRRASTAAPYELSDVDYLDPQRHQRNTRPQSVISEYPVYNPMDEEAAINPSMNYPPNVQYLPTPEPETNVSSDASSNLSNDSANSDSRNRSVYHTSFENARTGERLPDNSSVSEYDTSPNMALKETERFPALGITIDYKAYELEKAQEAKLDTDVSLQSMQFPLSDKPPPPPVHRQIRGANGLISVNPSRMNAQTSSASEVPSLFSEAKSNPSTADSSISAKSAGSLYRRKFHANKSNASMESLNPPDGSLRPFISNFPDKSEASFQTTQSSGIVLGGSRVAKNTYVPPWAPDEPIAPVKRAPSTFKRMVSRLLSGRSSSSKRKPTMVATFPGQFPVHEKPSDWQNVRRDIHRAASQTLKERSDKIERLEKEGITCIDAIHLIEDSDYPLQGSVDINGGCVPKDGGIRMENIQFSQVDNYVRQLSNFDLSSVEALAKNTICRPFKSDVQRLRAIFIFHTEHLSWEPDTMDGQSESFADVDPLAIYENRRGTTYQIACCFKEMCESINLWCEVVKGYLKTRTDFIDVNSSIEPNHFWNVSVISGEFRLIDCALASSSHPLRPLAGSTTEDFFFLAKPTELIYTHIPEQNNQQYLIPTLDPSVALALPNVTSVYFQSGLKLMNFDSSINFIADQEYAQVDIAVPLDIEVFAELEAYNLEEDADGDRYETGDITKKICLSQVYWNKGTRAYRIKAVFPGDEAKGILKIYAGRKGLMHSIKDNPYPLAVTIPIIYKGNSQPFDFVIRHPTIYAQKHDLYVRQPQTATLFYMHNYLFSIRQHSSYSMTQNTQQRPAKLAIQSPSGVITRLKHAQLVSDPYEGQVWEVGIKVTEAGTWRALVLGEKIGRWVVFAEWICRM